MSEHRRYFRIDDKVIVGYRVIDEKEKQMGEAELKAGVKPGQGGIRSILSPETQLNGLINKYMNKDPELGQLLSVLNDKINRQIKVAKPDDKKAYQADKPVEVNLSACGIAFNVRQKVEVDTLVVCEMMLLPDFQHLIAYGTLMLCKPEVGASGKTLYRVAIDFDYMLEEAQETLIQHILKKQTSSLKERKNKEL